MTQLLIIGGSDAGISAALRIKELDRQADITVVLADNYPGYSICGLPFLLSGEVTDWRSLAHHKIQEFEELGIHLLPNQRTESILRDNKTVRIVSREGQTQQVRYDKLLIATGAESTRPPIGGLGEPGVFFLRWMEDGFSMQEFMNREHPKRAVIIGGGYIGLEMADALTHRGLKVTVLEFLPEILSTMDPEMGRLIRTELESKGVRVVLGKAVQSIERKNDNLQVHTASGETEITDMVLVATGVKASVKLAQSAGITLGIGGAIQVDRTMATSISDIWAAGDCVETWHNLINANVYMPLGTTAHKQGRVAGENMLGGKRIFQGSLGTQAVKVFDLVAAGTGLRNVQAIKAGFAPLTVTMTTLDHNPYYSGAKEMYVSITGDRSSGRLLGAQIVGHYFSEISKRIDIIAGAIFNNLLVNNL
ncbi:MAG TPA: FAD-dependent oxidoreductase, partial [Dehalococcoidia bacterium]|nr:FAD-dependent oxidoreductase [Dehalococcoidia bacterium]